MTAAPPGRSAWAVGHLSGPAAELHGRGWPDPLTRTAWVMRVERPALALGSAQSAGDVDAAGAARAGVEVVRRRSGGGAVLLDPDDPVWIDLVVPATDRLWVDDVGRATWWVGEAWCRALGALDVDPGCLALHRGPHERTAWSGRVCFAALGAGEVTAGGRKVVGISQRRTRWGARFQCAALLRWAPDRLVDLLALDRPDRRACLAAVAPTAIGVDDLVSGAGAGRDDRGDRRNLGDLRQQVEAAFLAALPGG